MTESQKIDGLYWIVKPGWGSSDLHLGQSEREVQLLLGVPESVTRKYKGQYFYNYPRHGLEVDFGKKGGQVEYLFFFREGFRENRQAPMETIHSIRPGDSRKKVMDLLGRPDSEGKAIQLNMGGKLAAWFLYNTGINLQFGEDDRIDMITITAAERI